LSTQGSAGPVIAKLLELNKGIFAESHVVGLQEIQEYLSKDYKTANIDLSSKAYDTLEYLMVKIPAANQFHVLYILRLLALYPSTNKLLTTTKGAITATLIKECSATQTKTVNLMALTFAVNLFATSEGATFMASLTQPVVDKFRQFICSSETALKTVAAGIVYNYALITDATAYKINKPLVLTLSQQLDALTSIESQEVATFVQRGLMAYKKCLEDAEMREHVLRIPDLKDKIEFLRVLGNNYAEIEKIASTFDSL